MQERKYYDYTNDRPLNVESDGCDLTDWSRRYGECPFARHPRGFCVFLPPHRLVTADEYAESDPYTVERNLESEFHRRRIAITIELLREAVSQIHSTPRILDVGCGQGHVTQAMREAHGTAEFTGLDYSMSAIEYAHDHFSGIDFSVGDAYDTPYSKEYFDVIVCNNLWEHVPDPLHLLNSIQRCLKRGGYIIVSTPSRYRLANLLRVFRGKPVAFMSAHHVTEYTVGQVIEQFAYSGFEVERIASKPISLGSWKGSVARRLLTAWIELVGSHHRLESTVFYLAKNA